MKQVVKAIYDYRSTDSRHLNFVAGSNILIITKDSSGWWYGSQDGKYGWIPSNFIEEVYMPSNDSKSECNIEQLSISVDNLLNVMDSSDWKLIMNHARNLWDAIKKLPQHKNTRKVERKISSAIMNPSKSMSDWIDSLEDAAHLCLEIIENSDTMGRRPSTTSTTKLDSTTSLVTPVSPEILGDDLVFNSLGKVKSGTLKALMEYLVDYEQSDHVFQTIFLTTYSLHMTSKELLNHLINTFYFQRKSENTCKLVVKILKAWIKSFLALKNENDSFVKSLHRFIDTGIRSFSPNDSNDCIQLLKRSTRLQEIRAQTVRDIGKYVKRLHSLNIIEHDASQISAELHSIYVKLYNQIEYTDWLMEKVEESKSIARLIGFSNQVSIWVNKIISNDDDFVKKSFKVYKLIKVSRYLFRLQNFQAVKDIVGELSTESLAKYSHDLDSENEDKFKSLLMIVTQSDNNYSLYHQKLKNIEGSYIPLLTTHCSSLYMVNNQLKNFTERGFLDFSKMAMISFSLEKVLVSQRLVADEIQ